MTDVLDTVKVKREGGKGYRLINRAKYDANPDAYELFDAPGKAPPTKAEVLALADGNFGKFQSAAIKLLGKENTPSKKDEILAAINALPDA